MNAPEYAAFFAALTPADLTRFESVFTDDARFVDPFNDVRGVAAVRGVFEHMFRVCEGVRFEITEIVGDADVAYLRWRGHLVLNGGRALPPIDGVSRVRFAADGRVAEHVDYWDAAGQLYARLPVLGALMRWLRRRLSAPVTPP
ncbi:MULTISPECIES: nuclear transport factor 2 family protein [Arhodomonas]|uniref:nuclear transport factor 2 family protein n=1 Tax=Arhodomonas TaxID=2368 RepID=UPI000376FFB9|nr:MULTISPECIES: nuclear transport factor 2 family protein [Arhodomonas]